MVLILAACHVGEPVNPDDIDTEALMHDASGAYLGYGNAEGQAALCLYSCLVQDGYDACGYVRYQDTWEAPFAGCVRECGLAVVEAPGWIEPWSSCVLDREPAVFVEATKYTACEEIARLCAPSSPCPNGRSSGQCNGASYDDLRESPCGWTCSD
jgi:hypothetical protein